MNHGGKRAGAGRPSKEPTKVIRVPESKVDLVKQVVSNGVGITGSVEEPPFLLNLRNNPEITTCF